VEFDAGIADRADGEGQSNPRQERKVDVDIEPLRLEAGETVGDGLERLTDCIEMVQAFLETKVAEVVGAEFVAQEGREFLILLEEGALEVGAEDMMAMLDLIDDGGELAAVPAVQAGAEDRGNLVGGEPPQAEFTTSLEQLVDGKVTLENKLRQYSIWLMA
jgi:hypothetical protein